MSAATPWNDKPNTKTVELPSVPAITDRTYGIHKVDLPHIIEMADAGAMITASCALSLATHIRELQAENAKLKTDVWQQGYTSGYNDGVLDGSNTERDKLKAELSEFGLRCAKAAKEATHKWHTSLRGDEPNLAAIVEQELNK